MKKSLLLLILCTFLAGSNAFSQNYPRTENPNYMQTRLYDDFATAPLNRKIWNVTSHALREGTQHRKLFIWVDSIATVNINERTGDLTLWMLSYPNYTTTDGDSIITANFIAGQVGTKDSYSYGIYECSANFSFDHGSFPAFWSMSSEDCTSSFNNEIDIVELKFRKQSPAQTLDNNIFYYPIVCGTPKYSPFPNSVIENDFNWGTSQTHLFKCVWTPSKIEFWVDDTKLQEFYNTGQEWYPQLPQHVILSQQIIDYNNDSPGYGIVTPQASLFHWVKVREFFLAPEITLSSNTNTICSSTTATMDVDPAATNITWALTPSGLFSGATTGTGKTANIVRASAANGAGKITYSFKMPSGETFTASKDFWVGKPIVNTQVPLAYFNGGTYNNACNSQWYSTNMDIQPSGCTVEWTRIAANPTSTEWYQSGNNVNFYFFALNQTAVYRVTASNSCGSVSYDFGFKSVDCSGGGGGCDVTYVLSPNPASDLVTITPQIPAPCDPVVAPAITESAFLSVYDQQGTLKQKIKYKSRTEAKIDVSKLKDGIYFVRVVDGNSTKQQTLVVHH